MITGHQSLTSAMELKGNILVSGNADSTVKVSLMIIIFTQFCESRSVCVSLSLSVFILEVFLFTLSFVALSLCL